MLTNALLLSRGNLCFTLAATTLHVETVDGEIWDFNPPLETNYDWRFDRFLKQPPKSNFKRLILETGLIKGLKRMSDKAVPKGLKDFEVERGYTRRPPIPYIPIQDEMSELLKKTSGASEYKLELPGGTKVQHPLWESGNNEAFLNHVMSAMSYVTRRGYFKEFEEAKREAGRAVLAKRAAEDLWLAAVQPLDGTESPEFVAFKVTDKNVVDKNLACAEVAGKMFVLYKNLLSKNARSKWTNIVASQIDANPWTDLKGTVHAEP